MMIFSRCSVQSADSHIVGRRGDAQRLAVGGVVLLGHVRSELNGHRRDVRAVREDLGGHLTGGVAEVVIADGERCNAAAGADAFLTGHNGDLGGDDNVCDGLGVGGCGVVSGDVDDVGVIGGTEVTSFVSVKA